MTWTQNATTGALARSGTTREAWLVGTSLPATYEVRAQSNDPADNIKVVVRSSGDARSCFECGVEGSDVIIRKVTYGVIGSALATAAHGLSAGETFTIRVQGTGTEIECSILKSSGAAVTVTYDTTDFQLYKHWGVATDEDNSAVQLLSSAERTSVQSTVSDVLVVVSGGDLWASFDGISIQQIASRVMSSDGAVSMDSLDGRVYIVGGGRARVFDPVAREVSDWVPTSGTLPGQTGDGVTTATIIRQYRGRIALAGMDDEPQNVYFSAVGDALAWDTAELAAGAAVALGVGRNVTAGEPIVALGVLSTNALLIGCVNSMYVLGGDAGDLASELIPIALTTGCSGRNAITAAEDGTNIVHSPDGLFVVSGTGVSPISRDVLTEAIQFARADREDYRVSLCRDPARHGLHVFLDDGTTSAVHFWYDELTGRYTPGQGGFFPQTYPVRPQCSAIWRGRPVIGTSDGRIVEFDNDSTSDLGSAIDSYVHLQLITPPSIEQDAILTRFVMTLATEGDQVSVEVFGGASAQDVYDAAERRTLMSATECPPRGAAICPRVRAPAMSVRIRNTIAGRRWGFEAAEASVDAGRRISRTGWLPAIAPGTSCTPGTNPSAGSEPEVFPSPPTVVFGCTDPTATNYDPSATSDDGSCVYSPPPPPPPAPDPEGSAGISGVYEP